MILEKPKSLVWIQDSTWEGLQIREKAYFILSRQGQFTQKEIQERLYFNTYEGYWRFRNRVIEKTKGDLNIYHGQSQSTQ